MSDFSVPAHPAPRRADLGAMRVRYTPGPLDAHDVSPDPIEQCRRWLADALEAGLVEPNAMVLSTASPSGAVSSRHVLLKELDDTGFVLYTNLESRKAQQMGQNPVAALCFPWFEMSRQVCVEGAVEVVDRETVAQYWAVRPRESQLGAWASEQSRPIESRAALHARLAEVDRRFAVDAAVPVPDGWGGYRVVPTRVELWQGQPGRMHDRLVYTRSADGVGAGEWTVERLQP